jgi:hypothetical protein
MRLKESKDNWKASNVLRKVSELPPPRNRPAKKNTNLWCKGKVSKEHDVYLIKCEKLGLWSTELAREYRWFTWQCKVCTKRFHTTISRDITSNG